MKKGTKLRRPKTAHIAAAALTLILLALAAMTAAKYCGALELGSACAGEIMNSYEVFEDVIGQSRTLNEHAAPGMGGEARLEDYRDFCGSEDISRLMEDSILSEAAHFAQLYNALGGHADTALVMTAQQYAYSRASYYHPVFALQAKLLEDEAQPGSELQLLCDLLADTLKADREVGMLLHIRAMRGACGFEALRKEKRFAGLRDSLTQEERYVLLCLSDVTLEELFMIRVRELGVCEARLEDCCHRIAQIQAFDLPVPLAKPKVSNMITYGHDSVSDETMDAGMDAIWR